jgi:hypothetical protein
LVQIRVGRSAHETSLLDGNDQAAETTLSGGASVRECLVTTFRGPI